ncbi:MAG: esterase family protein, partial [Sphingobacteriaceae bacterium]
LSMGGFGALHLGAKYNNLFKAMAGHSSITSLPQMKLFVEEDLANYSQGNKTDEDVLATILENRNTLPPIRFDCGTEDLLIDYNRELHRQLTEHGIAHTYQEFPGAHEWAYWGEHIKKSLLFFAKQL